MDIVANVTAYVLDEDVSDGMQTLTSSASPMDVEPKMKAPLSREQLHRNARIALKEVHLTTDAVEAVELATSTLLSRLSDYALIVIGEKREKAYAGIVDEMSRVSVDGLDTATIDAAVSDNMVRLVWLFIFQHCTKIDPMPRGATKASRLMSARTAVMNIYRNAFAFCRSARDEWFIGRAWDTWNFAVVPYIRHRLEGHQL